MAEDHPGNLQRLPGAVFIRPRRFGGEGPWIRGKLAPASRAVIGDGTNPVTTDAACMAVMGFDPPADRGTPPSENCDSTLRLAEDAKIGTRDLKRIEVIGTPIKDALFDFAAIRRHRHLSSRSREGRKPAVSER